MNRSQRERKCYWSPQSIKTVIDTGGWLDIAIAPEVVAKLRVRFTGTVTEATNGGGNKFQGLREFRSSPTVSPNSPGAKVGFTSSQASGDMNGPARVTQVVIETTSNTFDRIAVAQSISSAILRAL